MIKQPPAKFNIEKIDPSILAEIGKIIAWWGYLQFQLGVIIREATISPQDVGYLLTIGSDTADLCKMVKNISKTSRWINDSGIRKDLHKLAGGILAASGHRNEYAHGVFGFSKTGPSNFVRHHLKVVDDKVFLAEEVLTVKTLQIISGEARELWYRAQDITHRLKNSNRRGSH